jgi:hypothetical protein
MNRLSFASFTIQELFHQEKKSLLFGVQDQARQERNPNAIAKGGAERVDGHGHGN